MRHDWLLASALVFVAPTAAAQSTYYVSKSLGSDSHSATQAQSKATPWAHMPGMPSCTSNCASHTPAPGDKFILYGGDTWGASDLGIQWTWAGSSKSCVLPYGSGATSSCIYIGVDPAWWNTSVCGASTWCRPTFDAAGSNIASGGAYLEVVQPNPGVNNYIVIDNIEMNGMYNDATGGGGVTGVLDYGGDHVEVMNLYIHGWVVASGATNDGLRAFECETNEGGTCTATLFHNNVVDGMDTAQNAMFATYGGGSEQIYNNYYRYIAGALVGGANFIHDNTVEHPVYSFDGNHANGIFNFGPASGNYTLMYGNVVRHWEACAGCVAFWINGNDTASSSWVGYIFNNVIYDVNGNVINVGGHPVANSGTYYVFNNTVMCGDDTNYGGCSGEAVAAYYEVYDYNNHWISSDPSITLCTSSVPQGGKCIGGADPPDLVQDLAQAKAQGYVETDPVFSPALGCTSKTCGTVGNGKNLESYCTALAGVSAAAGTACERSTTYGVGYDTTHHAVIAPAMGTVPRPSSGSWDIGAYQCALSADGGCTTEPALDAGVLEAGTPSDGGAVRGDAAGGDAGDAGQASDAGVSRGGEGGAGNNPSGSTSGGCGCRTAGREGGGAGLSVLGLAGVIAARRRSRRSKTISAASLALLGCAACSSASSAPGDAGGDGPDARVVGDAAHDAAKDGAAHTVTLSWHASPTPGVTYTVLRSTLNGSDYTTQVSGVSGLTWTDTNVVSGTTYYYVVDDSIGSRTSAYSNEATARIP
jgi:hypothetical protein